MKSASPVVHLRQGLGGIIAAPHLSRDGARAISHVSPSGELLVGVAIALAYITAAALALGQASVALAAAAAAIAVASPVAGLATLTFILPMRETEIFPLNLPTVLLAATAMGCVLRLPRDHRPLYVHPGVVLAIGYAILSLLSVMPVVSGHPAAWMTEAAAQVSHIVTGVGIFVVASYLFRSISPVPILIVAISSAFLVAMLALMAYWRVGPVTMLEGLLSPTRGDRATGGFATANYLGFFLAQASLLGLGLCGIARGRARPVLAVALAAIVVALVVTYSRGAYLGTTAGVVVLAGLHSRKAAILVAMAAVVAVLVLYPTFNEAREGAGSIGPSAVMGREQSENWRRVAIDAGIAMFLTAPVFGVGFGVFQFLSPAYVGASQATASHNAYVQILAEQGLVGSLIVACFLALLVRELLRSSSPLRATALAMLVCFLIQSWFINSTTSIPVSGMTWLTMAAALAVFDRARRIRPQET